MRVFILLSLIIIFFGCQEHKTENTSNNSCKLSDTLINKIPYGINKDRFFSHISIPNNKLLLIADQKLDVKYKSWFHHDSLFSLEVEVFDSVHLNRFSDKIYHDFIKPENDYTSITSTTGQIVIDLFVKKYGEPQTKKIEGKIGEVIQNENGPNHQRHFSIAYSYEWECNSKAIKINFVEFSRIEDNAEKNVEKILSDKSYISGNYSDFKILYENLKQKSSFYKNAWEKDKAIQENELKQKEETLKKQTENI